MDLLVSVTVGTLSKGEATALTLEVTHLQVYVNMVDHVAGLPEDLGAVVTVKQLVEPACVLTDCVAQRVMLV